MPYDVIHMWNMKKNKETKLNSQIQRTDWWLPEVGWQVLSKIGGDGQKVETSNYKINKSWGYNVQPDGYNGCIFESC